MGSVPAVYVEDFALHGTYSQHYAYKFLFSMRDGRRQRFADAVAWAIEQWGEPSPREYVLTSKGGCWWAHLDSPWQFYGAQFYFRDADACFLFQLRWR